jgi:hypothetical protein
MIIEYVFIHEIGVCKEVMARQIEEWGGARVASRQLAA